ncbi:LEAF RUST 10 DISEASE-RESISTANCE LOCUS RECEPTOR-LIKE PROTEIN KINASE-like 1.2 isoform X5 [Tasmannia lanceolata]|uniref:LEAF RUST 10 DISEASE-RESISTANCE LOCUS RECEPTOR-LIKE PROTEIN KINASE-like 1.2 isoform X5 n=1 Tax=Tasmannia lanceolata TaxID=3420 RepID=UPI004063927C
MSPPHLHLLLLLLLFTSARGTPIEYHNCTSSFNCGNNISISYPFWSYNDGGDQYCGYPNLGLYCNNQRTVLSLPNQRTVLPYDEYYVEDINYNEQTITVVDIDLRQSTCPRVRNNVTLVATPLSFYSEVDLNFTLFFNCSSSPFSTAYSLSCLRSGTRQSYIALIPGGLNWSGFCEESVVVPVIHTAWNDSVEIGNYSNLLEQGFQLKWSSFTDCGACEESHGYCGYNTTLNFFCICEDGTYSRTCPPGTHKSEETKGIIIGVSTGVLVVLICIISLFCWCCRKRLRSKSSTLLSQNKFSDPSSRHDLEKCNSNFFGTPVFTYKELEEATENFAESRELGDGGFGTVYYGKLRDGRSVAVKRLYENNYKRVEQFMNEVEILSRVRHHNLVSLYGCTSRHSRELLLVYEFVPNGTVADHLHGERAQSGPLTWPIRMSIAIETAGALAYLHAVEPQIIHRDVKTNNILLDNNFQVKVADFGLSRLFPTDVTHVSTAPQGTPGYVDPDYHHCYQLTDKSDVYSFGVVLVELISSKPAVDITRNRHEINLAKMAINKIHNHALHEFVDMGLGFETDYGVRRMITLVAELAFRCLQEDREVRPSMEEVLEVLRGIESDDFPAKKAEDIDVPSDDVGLLNGIPPASPDTVMDTWASRTTTPNTSG